MSYDEIASVNSSSDSVGFDQQYLEDQKCSDEEKVQPKPEPVKIKNSQTYLDSMRKTFVDKCQFMKDLPECTTTIVDMGCADGSFIEFLRKIFPQYRYIGLETNEEFFDMCIKKNLEVYHTIQEMNDTCDMDANTTHLNMNSLIHEIYAYDKPDVIINDIKAFGFNSISVRDMILSFPKFDCDEKSERDRKRFQFSGKLYYMFTLMLSAVAENENWAKKFKQHLEETKKFNHDSIHRYYHFMLKYMYDENWEREVKENYLPCTQSYKLSFLFDNCYDIVSDNFFVLDYLVDKWMKDFKLESCMKSEILKKITTHERIVFVKNESRYRALFNRNSDRNSRYDSDLVEASAVSEDMSPISYTTGHDTETFSNRYDEDPNSVDRRIL